MDDTEEGGCEAYTTSGQATHGFLPLDACSGEDTKNIESNNFSFK